LGEAEGAGEVFLDDWVVGWLGFVNGWRDGWCWRGRGLPFTGMCVPRLRSTVSMELMKVGQMINGRPWRVSQARLLKLYACMDWLVLN